MSPIAKLKLAEKPCTKAKLIEAKAKTKMDIESSNTVRDPSIRKPLIDAYTVIAEAAVQKIRLKIKTKLRELKTINCEAFKNKVASVTANRPITGIKASFECSQARLQRFKHLAFSRFL
jgi:hypothetical protein